MFFLEKQSATTEVHPGVKLGINDSLGGYYLSPRSHFTHIADHKPAVTGKQCTFVAKSVGVMILRRS